VLSVDRSERRRQFLTEFARMLDAVGRQAEARAVCEQHLRDSMAEPPRTREDFYYDGLANYLLGRHERARYDFERSEGFSPDYYDSLVLRTK